MPQDDALQQDAMDVHVKAESESDSGVYHSPRPGLDSESDDNSNSASASHSNQTKPPSPQRLKCTYFTGGKCPDRDGSATFVVFAF
ncbi:hypothetical protein M422DRAFT_33530 [Sphaerobolus stellatus SS14]|uniref:Uncharacterized protein n=1 Tax=Sphaerobolus stellatus (strain SS14) TaxID=990650 RepID=A0A0C9VKH2_SPHS4|nr:hypothetical protein M422DRAFT_33530 [Sphaerobolus stellatus SS14]